MSQAPPTRRMREHPDLDQLKRQAKELLDAYRASSPDAVAEVLAYHRTATPDTFALHDAQFVLARAYGFESWPKLKAAVDGVTAAALHEAVERGDVRGARALLERRSEVVDLGRGESEKRALHIAVLRRDLPMTKLLLEFGADTDGGIWPNRDATGPRVIARERGYTELSDAMEEARRARGGRGPEPAVDTMRALRRAVELGANDAIVAVLEAHPEFVEMRQPDGCTPLHYMAGIGALEVTSWLLAHGGDVNGMWTPPGINQAWTPLDAAAAAWFCLWSFDYAKFEATAAFLLEHGATLSPLSAATLGRWDYFEQRSGKELEGWQVLEAAVRGGHPEVLRRLLDLELDPDERVQLGSIADQIWSAGGPLFHAVVQNDIEMARLLLARGADPNAGVFTAGSPTYRAYVGGNPEMIALVKEHGGWIDAGSAGYARQVDMARKMLAGEIDGHVDPALSGGQTVAEQLLWGGASSLCAEIVRMALDHIDWKPDDPRWFWMLWRVVPGESDYDQQKQAECCDTFKLILARCGPHHRAEGQGQTMLHEAIARDGGVGVQLATILLDVGARLDVRDELLKSTPLGWACRWGRIDLVKLLLARGADPIEADAEPWATPLAWATKCNHPDIVDLLTQGS